MLILRPFVKRLRKFTSGETLREHLLTPEHQPSCLSFDHNAQELLIAAFDKSNLYLSKYPWLEEAQ